MLCWYPSISNGYVVGGPVPTSPASTAFKMIVTYDFYYFETSFALSKHGTGTGYEQIHYEPGPLSPTEDKVVSMDLLDGKYKFQIADAWGDGGGSYTLMAGGTVFASGTVSGPGDTVVFNVSGGSAAAE